MKGEDGQGRTVMGYLPPGFHFNPTDGELIIEYLRRKVYNRLLPWFSYIRDVEIYNYNPSELYDNYRIEGETEMYFFTSRQRKYANGERPDRVAKGGYWKTTASKTPIGDEHNPIGHKRALVYYQGNFKKSTKTDWLMYEYTLPEEKTATAASSSRALNNMQLEGWVLCKIYSKSLRSETRSGKCRENVASTSSSAPLPIIPLQIPPVLLQTNTAEHLPCNVSFSSALETPSAPQTNAAEHLPLLPCNVAFPSGDDQYNNFMQEQDLPNLCPLPDNSLPHPQQWDDCFWYMDDTTCWGGQG